MPYLHWETDENRAWTSRIIRHIQESQVSSSGPLRNQEESLLRGYLPVKEENTDDKAAGGLHIRRTLDQFHHQTVKTDHRDRDQVVLRHCARNKIEQKIFMVDELWMWIIGDGKSFCQIEVIIGWRWHGVLQEHGNNPLHPGCYSLKYCILKRRLEVLRSLSHESHSIFILTLTRPALERELS
jgi:hypothetical protein